MAIPQTFTGAKVYSPSFAAKMAARKYKIAMERINDHGKTFRVECSEPEPQGDQESEHTRLFTVPITVTEFYDEGLSTRDHELEVTVDRVEPGKVAVDWGKPWQGTFEDPIVP